VGFCNFVGIASHQILFKDGETKQKQKEKVNMISFDTLNSFNWILEMMHKVTNLPPKNYVKNQIKKEFITKAA